MGPAFHTFLLLTASLAAPALGADAPGAVIDFTDPGAPTFIPPGSALAGAPAPLLGDDLNPRLLGGESGTLVRGTAPLLGSDLFRGQPNESP